MIVKHRNVISAEDELACHLCGVIGHIEEMDAHFEGEEHKCILERNLSNCRQCGNVPKTLWDEPYIFPLVITKLSLR